MEKSREFYLNSLEEGNIIAFRMEEKMYTGKVISIEEEKLTVMTKNGSVYYPTKENVVWVKNGTFWPQGVYNALKLTNKQKGSTEMPKTINIDETMEEIANLKKQIANSEALLVEKKQIMSKYFQKTGERTRSNDFVTVFVTEKINIEYDIPRIYKQVDKSLADKFIDKLYSVIDWKAFIKFLKSKGITNSELKEFIKIDREVNKKSLDKLYDAKEISLQDLDDCYKVEVTKSVSLRLKDAKKADASE